MKKYYQRPIRHALAVLTAGLVLGGLVTANAQNSKIFPTNVYYMSKSVPTNTPAPYRAGGGVTAGALIAAPGITNSVWSFSWYGMRGWSTIQGSTNLGANWVNLTNVAATNYAWTTTAPNPFGASAIFRLSQNNAYVGESACAGCHIDKYTPWTTTLHAGVYNNPAANTNFSLACLTIGYGQGGFTDSTNTPYLENVSCENCHGPAGWHKASDKDMITPAVSLDPTICGSCHQGSLHPTYQEYTNKNSAGIGILVTGATHAIGGHGNSLSCGICHQANTRMAMVKEYYDRLAGNPHPVTLFSSSTDAGAWAAACSTCHDPHGSTNVAQLRYPITSTNWFGVNTVTDPTPVLTTNSNGTITTNATSVVAYNTAFDSLYNPKVQVCGQCHAGGGGAGNGGMRWDGSAYGWMTNLVVSNYVSQAGYYVGVTSYVTNVQVFTNISYGYIWTNGASVGVTNTTITTNSYVIPYATNQVWLASITNSVTNLTRMVTNYYPPIAYTNGSGVVTNTLSSSGETKPHYPVQYNVLIGQLDYDLAARGGPPNVLSDAHTLSPNQCADCHVPSYPVVAGVTNVTGHTFVNDYNSPGCLASACHASYTNNAAGFAVHTLNYKVSVSNSMSRVVSLLRQWGTNVAPAILATNYGPLAWEYPSINSYFSTKSTNVVGGVSKVFSVGPPSTWNGLGGQPSFTNDNVQLNYVPQDIRMIRFALNVLYEDQSYGVHNPTYTSNLLAWAENDLITNQFIAAGWPTFSADVVSGAAPLTVHFTNTGSGSGYSWTFGDGQTAASANPSCTYSTPGLYSVTCTVDSSKSLTRTQYILVQ